MWASYVWRVSNGLHKFVMSSDTYSQRYVVCDHMTLCGMWKHNIMWYVTTQLYVVCDHTTLCGMRPRNVVWYVAT